MKGIKVLLYLAFFSNLYASVLWPQSSVAQVESVSQMSDVSPADSFFRDLKSLVEKYGCYTGYPDGTLRARRNVTRTEFAAVLNSCLSVLSSKAEENGNLSVFMKRINKYSESSGGINIKSVSQIRDIKPTDWGFEAIQNLVERYKIVLVSRDGLLRGQSTVTFNELGDYMNGIFRYSNVPLSNKSVTRADLTIYLNRSLNLLLSDLFS